MVNCVLVIEQMLYPAMKFVLITYFPSLQHILATPLI